jgi:hypothetical protein
MYRTIGVAYNRSALGLALELPAAFFCRDALIAARFPNTILCYKLSDRNFKIVLSLLYSLTYSYGKIEIMDATGSD